MSQKMDVYLVLGQLAIDGLAGVLLDKSREARNLGA
jgi:hypothetical protein